MKVCRHLIAVLLALGCFALISCGSGSGSGSPITGSVTLDDQPLAAASVKFHTTTSGAEVASARSDDTGKFTLPSPAGKPALKPGHYTVTVRKLTDKKGNVPKEEDFGMLEAEGNLVNKLPAKYGDPQNSKLSVEVKTDTKTLPAIDVKSK